MDEVVCAAATSELQKMPRNLETHSLFLSSIYMPYSQSENNGYVVSFINHKHVILFSRCKRLIIRDFAHFFLIKLFQGGQYFKKIVMAVNVATLSEISMISNTLFRLRESERNV